MQQAVIYKFAKLIIPHPNLLFPYCQLNETASGSQQATETAAGAEEAAGIFHYILASASANNAQTLVPNQPQVCSYPQYPNETFGGLSMPYSGSWSVLNSGKINPFLSTDFYAAMGIILCMDHEKGRCARETCKYFHRDKSCITKPKEQQLSKHQQQLTRDYTTNDKNNAKIRDSNNSTDKAQSDSRV